MSRIILKISGEALKKDNQNISEEKLKIVLKLIEKLQKMDHKIAIVVGGGNFFRGRDHEDMNKVTADTIGMLGTVMNALFIKDYLEKNSINTIVNTPFSFPNLIDDFENNELKKEYESGKVIIFGGGIGKSGYSTDSGTILASNKVEADLIIKLTNVNGVYNADPKKDKHAIKFDKLTYNDVLQNKYEVMDAFAIEECMNKNIKILVMNFEEYEKIDDYFNGKIIGTIIG